MPKFLLYLPYSDFIDAYRYKALGSIPIAFKNSGYDSHLIVGIMKSDDYKTLGITIHETGNLDTEYVVSIDDNHSFIPRIKNMINFNEFIKAYKIMVKERPDILMSFNNSTLTGFIILLYRIRFLFKNKTKLVLKLDNDGSEFIKMSGFRRKILSLYFIFLGIVFNRIIVESSCGYNAFSKIPVFGKKLRIIPNSISDNYTEKQLNNKREKTIITVSRIVREKNIDLLIRAFASIASEFPAWNLEIIGPDNDKDYYNSLNDLVLKLDLKDRIKFLGAYNFSQLKDKYSKSSIFCLFSKYESFAISRLEAASMGMYVISSTAGCAVDFLQYGIHTVSVNDMEASINEIRQAIITIEKGDYNFKIKKIFSYDDAVKKIISDSF